MHVPSAKCQAQATDAKKAIVLQNEEQRIGRRFEIGSIECTPISGLGRRGLGRRRDEANDVCGREKRTADRQTDRQTDRRGLREHVRPLTPPPS